MANNNLIFNGALAGALGGNSQAWLTNTSSASYTALVSAVVGFATEVDSRIATNLNFTISDAALIQSICQAVFAGRFLKAGNNIQALAASVVALFTAAQTQQLNPEVLAVSSLGYTAAAPIVITLLPAGHIPGIYSIAANAIVRTVAGAGSITRSMQYTAPGGNTAGTSGFGATVITALGPPAAGGAITGIVSDGSAPISVTWTPAGIAGSPVVDLYQSATLTARLS